MRDAKRGCNWRRESERETKRQRHRERNRTSERERKKERQRERERERDITSEIKTSAGESNEAWLLASPEEQFSRDKAKLDGQHAIFGTNISRQGTPAGLISLQLYSGHDLPREPRGGGGGGGGGKSLAQRAAGRGE